MCRACVKWCVYCMLCVVYYVCGVWCARCVICSAGCVVCVCVVHMEVGVWCGGCACVVLLRVRCGIGGM